MPYDENVAFDFHDFDQFYAGFGHLDALGRGPDHSWHVNWTSLYHWKKN